MKVEPKRLVMKYVGGLTRLAEICDRDPSVVSRWHELPAQCQRVILKHARKKSLNITADDIIFGREMPKTEFDQLGS